MPAIAVVAAFTGAATAVGAAAATAIGLGTVSTLAATAIGSGIIAGGTTAIMGGDVSDVLESAVVGGLTSYVGGSVASSVGDVVTQTTGSEILGKVAGNVAATAVTGGDEEAIVRSGLLGGLSQSLKDTRLNRNDAYEFGSTDVNADYSLANGMNVSEGLKLGTSANLDTMGGGQGFTFNVGDKVTTIADAIDAIDTMNGTFNAANLDTMGGGQGLTYQTDTGLVTEGGTLLVGGNTGNNSVIGETGVDTAYNIGDGIGDTLADIDTGVYDSSDGLLTSVITNSDSKDSTDGLTTSDVINLINTALVVADTTDTTDTVTDGNRYPIIPIPTDWTSPPPTGVAPFTPLTPINFGDRNLLIGTQWERLLDPNYGQVPEPIQYSQPSSLSYNDLMAILGSKQGMPAKSSLSINDIISGIQNQYGQAPTGTMG
jgi:hypothetical protein